MESPELALWRAVISQAIKDGLKYHLGRPTEQDKSDAEWEHYRAFLWFMRAGYNFRFACDMADLDPVLVRKTFIKKYQEKFNADPF